MTLAGAPEPFVGAVETHTGAVFFAGDTAYKMKKPVAFGFLDFRRLEDRKVACEREVRLNSRLAPDVYQGVADVIGPDGSPCEHLVVMRRLPHNRCLSVIAAEGLPVEDHLGRIATTLSRFHGRSARSADIDACASTSAVLDLWEANVREMRHRADDLFDPGCLSRIVDLARRYLDGRRDLFSARIAAGRVCEGHGDLLWDDIFLLEDGPRILDCLDFDERLRHLDVLSDIASLAMDLERLGRPDLGRVFLERYRAVSHDDWPQSLAHHYIAYRALVRAMVAGLRYGQGSVEAAQDARTLLTMSARHLEAGRVRLVVIGGLPGTGKSTLARQVAEAVDGTWIRSDVVRKRLAGLRPDVSASHPLGEGIYSASATEATYGSMIDSARSDLLLGRNVVLDATFTQPAWRAAARELAERTYTDLAEFRCVAPMSVIEQRLGQRSRGDGPSDATAEVARYMARSEVPWPTATDIDTSHGVAGPLGAVLERMDHFVLSDPPSKGPAAPGRLPRRK